jgi:hypothetical protein
MSEDTRNRSILNGTDGDALCCLLSLHAVANPRILDCTYNTGKMWKGLDYRPIRMDIDGTLDLDIVADFAKIPFAADSLDVVVFDPPHLPTAGMSQHSTLGWDKTYGITARGDGREGDNVSGMFLPFLTEAKRVLSEDGIILAKIADLTHNHRYQWQHVDFIVSAQSVGMTPCDLLIKRDPMAGNIESGRWQQIKHLRKCHCYWIVVRNSLRCERCDGARSVKGVAAVAVEGFY